MAPGTGLWTKWLLDAGAQRITAIDASPAMLERLRARLGERADHVEMVIGDLFDLSLERRYDGVFFGFFLSHVPRDRLASFFDAVGSAVEPGGVVGLVDSRLEPTSTAIDHVLPEANSEVMTRRLDDGREFRIVKNFYEPDEIVAAAATAGIEMQVTTSSTYFVVGTGISVR